MGVLELLTLTFVLLKAFEVIDWSWWLVFSPMYVYVVILLIWLFFAFIVGVLGGVADAVNRRKFRK